MKRKWIVLFCIFAVILSLGSTALASGEASGASKTRGDVMEVTVPETRTPDTRAENHNPIGIK